MKRRRLRLPARNSALLALVAEGFLSRLSFGIISFAVPLFGLRLGLSIAEIGFLASFNLMVAITLKPAAGWIADRAGVKHTFVAAIITRSFVSLLLVFASAPWHLYAVRGLHGVSIALRDPAANALVADAGGKDAIASAFAWYQTAKTVAGAVGKTLAGLLLTLTATSFPTVFAVAFGLSLLPLPVVIGWIHDGSDRVRHSRAARAHVSDVPPAAEISKSTRCYVTLGFLISGTAYMLTNLFPVLATEYAGLSEAQTGSIYLLTALVSLSGPLWGWLSDHVNRTAVLSFRSVANIMSSAIYLAFPGYAGLAVGRALDDAGKAAFRPAWGAVMAQVARMDPRRRGRVMSRMSAGEDAGEMLGPVAAGLIWSAFGVPAVLIARIAMSAVAEVYALRLHRREPGRSGRQSPTPKSGGNVQSTNSEKDSAALSAAGHHEIGE